MITATKLKGIMSALSFEGVAHVPVSQDLEIELQVSEDYSKMKMSAAVFHGTDYIPKGIRRCIKRHPRRSVAPKLELPAVLSVDEEHFRIDLNYVCEWQGVKEEHRLVELLDEFSHQVEDWHRYIHGHGEGDLVFVYAR